MSTECDQGLEALKQGNVNAAIPLLEQAIQVDSNDFNAHLYLGAAYSQADRANDAVTILTQSVHLQPSNAQARFNLGIALQKAGWANEAATAFEQALTLQPDYPQAQQALSALRPPQVPQAQVPTQIISPQQAPQYTPINPQGYAPPQQLNSYAPPQQGYGQAPGAPNYANLAMYQNTSGMNSDVPLEIAACKWNWASFLWSWIWLIGHGMVWQGIGLLVLSFIPIISIASLGISIYLGIKGHEIAWKNRRFDSVEQCFAIQRKYVQVWCIIFGVFLVLGLIAVMMIGMNPPR